jgi:hypothetical protein
VANHFAGASLVLCLPVFLPFAHLVFAAFLAIRLRCSGVSLSARTFAPLLPPFLPPLRPISRMTLEISPGSIAEILFVVNGRRQGFRIDRG